MLKAGGELAGKDYGVDFTILDISSGYELLRVPSKTWKELIKKVWEIDFFTCPRCGSVVIWGTVSLYFLCDQQGSSDSS